MSSKETDRNSKLVALHDNRKKRFSFSALGKVFHVTPQRAHQIYHAYKRHFKKGGENRG